MVVAVVAEAVLGVGLRRDAAATFAFLLAIPAIGGAGALEGLEMLEAYQTIRTGLLQRRLLRKN